MTSFGFRYPAVIVLGCAVAGTLLGRAVSSGLSVFAAVAILAALVLAYAYLRLPAGMFIIPLAVFVIAGSAINAELTYHLYSGDDIGHYVGGEEKLRFFAKVDAWPVVRRHKTVLTCRVDSIATRDAVRRSRGLIHIIIRQETTAFAYGDKISFEGYLRRPLPGTFPGQFDYARYLRGKGVRGTVMVPNSAKVMMLSEQRNLFGRTVNGVRGWILACFRSNLTATPAALASGFLIGETHNIPDPVYLAFRRTGTMHLLAVSGSNVALVLVAAFFLLRFVRLNSVFRAIILLAVIILFSNLSYNQPSVVRASIMAALIIGARIVYRRGDLNNIIAAAAVILILTNPANLFDVGFQLSFAVTWGLILFLPSLNTLCERFNFPKWLRYVSLIIFSSFIATLISAPITAYYFGEMSLVAVASNLIVVPLVSAAVLGSLILLGVNLLFPPASIVVGMFLDRLLRLILEVVVWFGRWEFAEANLGSFSAAMVFLCLGGAASLFLCVRYRAARFALAGIGLIAVAAFFAGDIMATKPSSPEVEIYNTGSAHAVVINQGGGLVIFRQFRDDPYDEFSSDLLPYLADRSGPFPRYFVFLEPSYRTEHHLELAAESGIEMKFYPETTMISSEGISVKTISENLPDDPIRPPIINYVDGILSVQILNSKPVFYGIDLGTFVNESVGRGEAGYYIAAANEMNEPVSCLPPAMVSRMILLVPEANSTEFEETTCPAVIGKNGRLALPPQP